MWSFFLGFKTSPHLAKVCATLTLLLLLFCVIASLFESVLVSAF